MRAGSPDYPFSGLSPHLSPFPRAAGDKSSPPGHRRPGLPTARPCSAAAPPPFPTGMAVTTGLAIGQGSPVPTLTSRPALAHTVCLAPRRAVGSQLTPPGEHEGGDPTEAKCGGPAAADCPAPLLTPHIQATCPPLLPPAPLNQSLCCSHPTSLAPQSRGPGAPSVGDPLPGPSLPTAQIQTGSWGPVLSSQAPHQPS